MLKTLKVRDIMKFAEKEWNIKEYLPDKWTKNLSRSCLCTIGRNTVNNLVSKHTDRAEVPKLHKFEDGGKGSL